MGYLHDLFFCDELILTVTSVSVLRTCYYVNGEKMATIYKKFK